ncbi:acyltransferase family protein [Actinocorallia sp. API 0066]|uniref:acyltransferase family protein n=1 Tax=Actinocorallia sp. API 0066 TaxID=2896846 RepID=UPI001E35B258|nr:acyltransferase family protein [Actinocorallia sp. API 0066]MCD0448782.1 acyltransferase family protein [Actinocorallia sp. API 0066]
MSSREAYFDNAKFLIGGLVVMGHAIDYIDPPHAFEAFEMACAAFRMPVFAFLVGYFTQGFLRSHGRARRLVAKIAIAYLIFLLLYQILEAVLKDLPFGYNPLDPYDHLWFLTAMFVWRGVAPLWLQLRHPVAVAVFVSLAAGLVELQAFTRIVSMLPFVVLGLVVRREHLEPLRRRGVRVAAGVVLAAEFAAFLVLLPDYISGKGVLYNAFANSYAGSELSAPVGMGVRAFFVVTALVAGAAVLSLVPTREGLVSRLGGRSLYMYVLHYGVIQVAVRLGWFDLLPQGLAGALIVVVLAFALGAVLCSPPVAKVFHRLMEPPTSWLFARPAPKPEPAAPVDDERRTAGEGR